MKIQKKSHHKINSITPGRWTAYAAAGAASALTGPNSAEAEIHYSGNVHIHLVGDARATLPLSNGASLAFENFLGGSTFIQNFHFLIRGVISGSARGDQSLYGADFVSALDARKNVSDGRFYSVTGAGNAIGILFTNWSDGQFRAPADGFLAFRFNTGKGTQYGWARIKTKTNFGGPPDKVHDLIKDYAWGDPGDAILTGQRHSLEPASANSVAGSLGLLAFGAQGLDAWRTQRTQKSD